MNHIKEHRDQIMKSITGRYNNAEEQVVYSSEDFLNLHKEFFTPHNFHKFLELVKSENINTPEQGEAKREELIKSFQPTKVQYGDEVLTMYAKQIDLDDNIEKGGKRSGK